MTRILLFLFIIINSTACASSFLRLNHIHSGIDPEFQQQYDYFYFLTEAKQIELTIGFVDDIYMPFNQMILGTSNRVILGGNEIDINRKYWKTLSYAERDLLILHEMGHAVCKLAHSDYNPNPVISILESVLVLLGQMTIRDNFPDGCPSNAMSTLMPSTMCIQKHYIAYMISLQEGCKHVK